MDKLKYIKLENEDGSYSSSIPLAVDSDHVDIIGTQGNLTEELNKKALKTELESVTTNLETQIHSIASGSPAGVYSTVAELIATNPDHSKIYIVSADGHWYYYNNNQWNDGGIYQATGIEDFSITPDKLNENNIINKGFKYEIFDKLVTPTVYHAYVSTNRTASSITINNNRQYRTLEYNVNNYIGQKIYVQSYFPSEVGGNIFVINFVDGNDVLINCFGQGKTFDFSNYVECTIPTGAVKMYVQASWRILPAVYFLTQEDDRKDVKDLNNSLDSNCNAWEDITINAQRTDNYFYNHLTDSMQEWANASMWDYYCESGEQYRIVTSNALSNLHSVLFYDKHNNIVSTIDSETIHKPLIITIPDGVVQMKIQSGVADRNQIRIFKKSKDLIELDELYKKCSTGDLINSSDTLEENVFYNSTYSSYEKFTSGEYKVYTLEKNTHFTANDYISIKTYLPDNATIYGLIVLDENNKVIYMDMRGTTYDFNNNYYYKIPQEAETILIQGKKIYTTEVYKITKIIDFNNELKNIKNAISLWDYHDITNTITIEEGKFYNFNSHNYNDWTNGACTEWFDCSPGDIFRLTSTVAGTNMNLYCVKNGSGAVIYAEPVGSSATVYTEKIIQIPDNGVKILINSNLAALDRFKIEKLMPSGADINQKILECEMEIDTLNKTLETDQEKYNFEIENLQRRCHNLEDTTDFAWKDFDKSYFAFVIDDCNSFVVPTYDLFHEAEVPLGVATIVNKLNTIYKDYEPENTRSVKNILELVEADGGEVLAHYGGNLADPEYAEAHPGTTYITSEEGWEERTRNVKKTLNENGFTVRGIILADSSQANSNNGEYYCRKYFDYSDNVGKSSEYKLGRRKFFIGVSTMQDMKNWIDTACQTPGFYPFCLHGNRQDEPLATVENLTEIVNYIKGKGNNIAEITTYSKVFDKFKTTTIEKRLSDLESHFNN